MPNTVGATIEVTSDGLRAPQRPPAIGLIDITGSEREQRAVAEHIRVLAERA